MKSVEFIKPWKIYSRGDIAGFDAEQADKLVEGGVAKPHKVEKKAKDAKEPAADTGAADAEK